MTHRSRNLLHKNQEEAFIKWMLGKGWTSHPPRPGSYERLRFRKEQSIIIIHDRNSGDHFTTQGLGTQMAQAFIQERKNALR